MQEFLLCVSNKIFEYVYAGLPLLVAVSRPGMLFEAYDPRSVAGAIRRLSNPDLQRRCARIPDALRDLNADKQLGKLASLHDPLAKEGSLTRLAAPLGRS